MLYQDERVFNTNGIKVLEKQIRNPQRENPEQYSFMTPFANGLHRWSSPMAFTDGLRQWPSLVVFTDGIHQWSLQKVIKENVSIGSRKPKHRRENPNIIPL